MGVSPFHIVLLLFALAALLSFFINSITEKLLSHRFLIIFVRAPGVIVHEFFHTFACLLTGATVKEIQWFDSASGGGHVIHGQPKLPVIGMLLISLMPLLGIPLLLLGITCLLPAGGAVSLLSHHQGLLPLDIALLSLRQIVYIVYENIVIRGNIWFGGYLYLTTSLLIGLVPSKEDILKKEVPLEITALLLFDWLVRSVPENIIGILWNDLLYSLISLISFGISCEILVILILSILLGIQALFGRIVDRI